MIHSSDPDLFKKLSGEIEICRGATALLTDDLCNMFKSKISGSAGESDKKSESSASVLGTFTFLHTTKNDQRDEQKIYNVL